jgi:D-arabinose 1-dehydrogenase-like Zn-dependent alcohol dehydrogenase
MEDYMLAVVCHGPEDYRIERLPKPKPGKGEVLVKVLAAGICAINFPHLGHFLPLKVILVVL